MPLVMDFRISHERFGSTSTILFVDTYITLISDVLYTGSARTSGRLHSEFVCLLFFQDHRETDRFFAASGVHNQTVDSSTSAAPRSPHSSNLK